jgi:tetratricopeptide (TPR) repeat protein
VKLPVKQSTRTQGDAHTAKQTFRRDHDECVTERQLKQVSKKEPMRTLSFKIKNWRENNSATSQGCVTRQPIPFCRWVTLLLLLLLPTIAGMGCRSTAAQSRAETTTEEFLRTLQQAQEKSAANDWGNAIAAWEKVVQLNPVTGEYWYELAEARYKNKDYRGALPAYEQSLRFGFALPSSRVRDMARCHAMLGDKEQALTILERAFTLGYRRLELIRNDPAFQSLRNEARFQKLVAVVDTSKMSREEGWRYDLQLLAREVKRLRYQPFRSISEMDFDAAVKKIHECAGLLVRSGVQRRLIYPRVGGDAARTAILALRKDKYGAPEKRKAFFDLSLTRRYRFCSSP